MKPRTCVAFLLVASYSLSAQAGVAGKCTFKGKNLAFVDGVAALAPDPFEEKTKVPQIWFTTKALDHALIAAAKPGDIDHAITEQAFDKDLATLQLRLDAAGKLAEGLQLYVPPGTSQSMSSNEVGKLTLKAALTARATGRWTLADDDLKCDISFDLPMGAKAGAPGAKGAAAAAAKPWGTALPKGGGEPGKVYMAMHKATLAGDVDGMLATATKARADEMRKARKEPEFAGMLELIKALEPKTVAIVSGQADAKRAELQIAGKDADGANMTGTVKLVMEGGAWKIEKVSTESKSGN